MNIIKNIETAGQKVLDGVFPGNIYCLCCGSIIDNSRKYSLCDKCIRRFTWVGARTCENCGKILPERYSHTICPDCRQIAHSFDRGFTCAAYGLYERMIMMDYKYSDKSYIGRIIGEILYDRMKWESIEYDFIVPIPVHKARLAKRGYNQAELMAKFFARLAKKPVRSNILRRDKETLPMRGLGAGERRENMRNAFSIISANTDILASANVLLIDDIYTTGSTLDSAASTLKEAGAKRVYTLTFAAGESAIK